VTDVETREYLALSQVT